MSIIADRGLFVRLLVQSGRFDAPGAESFADAVDAATREPATKLDLEEMRNELKGDIAELRNELKLDIAELRNELKLDIAELRNELKLDIAELRSEMKQGDAMLRQEIAELRKDLHAQSNQIVIKMGGLLVVLAGLVFAALRLPH